MLTKTEAAELLRVSERTIERLVAKGKLPVADYLRGEGKKPSPLFDPDEVLKAGTGLQGPKPPKEPHSGAMALVQPVLVAPGPDGPGTLAEIIERAIAAGIQAGAEGTATPTATLADLSVKRLWTVREAARMTGQSVDAIRAAIRAGELQGHKRGRGLVVTPAAVDRWIEGWGQ